MKEYSNLFFILHNILQSKQCRQTYKYSRSNSHYSGITKRHADKKQNSFDAMFSAAKHKPFIIRMILPFALAQRFMKAKWTS